MKWRDIKEDGRIVKGVNTTADVSTNEIPRQAAKFGNKVDKDGRPPTLSKKVRGKSTNVLFNLGLAEGYKLQLERDKQMLVLNIKNTTTGQRTEVRGKPGYETGNYDPNDKLHMLLDQLGKSVDISQLMNGEPVGINPKHPQGASAKVATDKAYNESKLAERFTPMEIALMEGGHSIEVYRREQLPQIKNKQLAKLKHKIETVALTDIMPVQEERIIENFKRQVDKIVAGEYKPIIVDKNYKIVNGHHRYTALQMLKYENVQVAVLPWTLEKILEKWSNKYKKSINCNNPKGFSQKAHCAGRKKK
jgi:hypothetical protein